MAVGLTVDRLKSDRDNPLEVALVEQWKEEHDLDDVLGRLLRVPCQRDDPDVVRKWDGCGPWKLPLGEPTERDRIIAATVVQWLGSEVGMSFLRAALSQCDYVIWPRALTETDREK